ncbi:MAG: hypothetical protein ACLFTA_03045 [Candidatus Nanohaloarchaea archaeon]
MSSGKENGLTTEEIKRLQSIKEEQAKTNTSKTYPDEWSGGELDDHFYQQEYLDVATEVKDSGRDLVKTSRIADSVDLGTRQTGQYLKNIAYALGVAAEDYRFMETSQLTWNLEAFRNEELEEFCREIANGLNS